MDKKISIKNRVSIEQRPEIVDTKQRFGDRKINTIVGANNKGAIVTIVEIKTVVRLLYAYSKNVHSITGDNGTEFADHQNIAKLMKTQFFFTLPFSSWEKRLIENTNKLVRQYIPKKTNFNTLNQQQIKEIQYKINNRPRKNLNFYSPKEIFFRYLNPKVAFTS